MKHLLTISQDSEATYKEYDVAYYNDDNDKVFVKKYYETPFIEILTDSLYHNTSIIPLKAKKCGNIDGDIVWSFQLLASADSDTASINEGFLRFSKHYEGGVKLTATAGSVTAEKTVTIDCIETPLSVTYGVIQPSATTVDWNTTEAVITYTGQITETFALKPQTRVTKIEGLTQTVTVGTNPPVETSYATGNEYVDLGLTGGLKWAKCSIGAMNEYEDSLYFQWGDVDGYVVSEEPSEEPKAKVYTGSFKWNGVDVNWTVNQEGFQKVFDWANYKYCNGSSTTMTKYCLSESYGTVDNKSQLEAEDDAAIQNLRSQTGHENARMPKPEEYLTLINETIWVWSPGGKVGVKKTDENGTETIDYVDYPTGYFVFRTESDKGGMGTFSKDETTGNLNGFTASSGTVYYPGAHEITEGDTTRIVDGDTHIFFSASGGASGTGVGGRGSYGNYWSSSLYASNSDLGHVLGFNSGNINPQSNNYRYLGFCVRSVSEN